METVILLEVEVAYALSHRQFLRQLKLPTGSTAEDAIRESGVLSEWPDIDLDSVTIGIFSRPVDLNTTLKTGDRVEIYRSLILAPTDVRRIRTSKSGR